MKQILLLAAAIALASCGVKSDLTKPPGPLLQMQERDPSKPPVALGDPTRVVPAYPTGP